MRRTTTHPAQRFGRALQQARQAASISQQELANKAGVTQPNVSAWEQGRYAPEPAQVFTIEAALKVPPGYLSAHLGFLPTAAGTAPVGDVPGAIMASHALDAHDKRALLAMFEQLAKRPRRR